LNGIQKVSGSIPLISTTHLIHHICPMWFFLFFPLTAISDSLDFMRHFVPLKSVPYFAAASSHCFSSISQTLRFPGISDSLDFTRHFIPLESVPYLTGSIPLISTTHLIHHICPMWFFLFIPLTAISDSLDSMRHFIPLESVPYLTGSIPLISTTYLIHHICSMWFFLFILLTAISDSLDFMRHFIPLESVYLLQF
jgi:hypothetical protein